MVEYASVFAETLSTPVRILLVLIGAPAVHLLILATRKYGSRLLTSGASGKGGPARDFPKIATISTLVISTVTFLVYFLAGGFILHELGISLTAYIATASVIGLAVGFGSQGLVQDIVNGLTLIFSDVIDVGDVVDIAGQTGRIDHVGLRFTVLVNLHQQRVFLPNRNITQINRYREGNIRAHLDVQLPDNTDPDELRGELKTLSEGFQAQHRALVHRKPDVTGPHRTTEGNWRYFRTTFHLWPGQTGLIEGPFKQRLLNRLKRRCPEYSDWMITVTNRASEPT